MRQEKVSHHARWVAHDIDATPWDGAPVHWDLSDAVSHAPSQGENLDVEGEPVDNPEAEQEFCDWRAKPLEPTLRVPQAETCNDASEPVEPPAHAGTRTARSVDGGARYDAGADGQVGILQRLEQRREVVQVGRQVGVHEDDRPSSSLRDTSAHCGPLAAVESETHDVGAGHTNQVGSGHVSGAVVAAVVDDDELGARVSDHVDQQGQRVPEPARFVVGRNHNAQRTRLHDPPRGCGAICRNSSNRTPSI